MSSSSASEGEIVETEVDKASSAQLAMKNKGVDRPSRTASTVSSPTESVGQVYDRYRSRSRSPYRHSSPRRDKRRRDEAFPQERDRHDPRRFKVRYESGRSREEDRHRVSYADIDRNDTSRYSRHDDRQGRDSHRRRRTRSRSPGFPGRGGHGGRSDRYNRRSSPSVVSQSKRGTQDSFRRDQGSKFGDHNSVDRMHDRRGIKEIPLAKHESNAGARDDKGTSVAVEKERHSESATSELAEQVEVDDATLIEQRRKRREALKAKYKSQPKPLLVQALQLGGDAWSSNSVTETPTPAGTRSGSPAVASPQPSDLGSPVPTSGQDDDVFNHDKMAVSREDNDEASAADYDPTKDMQEDRAREDRRLHHTDADKGNNEIQEPNASRKVHADSKLEFDMFADDDDDDMFAVEHTIKALSQDTSKKPKELAQNLLDNWDDPDGYYRVILGELLDGRYHVLANLGKGMFSGVVRATDNKTEKLVAIKIIRNNETMKKAGMKEIDILQKLNSADPDDKKHLIKLERSFDHKGHLCMVFENLSINLREVLKKFGRDVGINLRAVRSYAQQMLLSLSLMKKCNILHADLKPDNILVNESRTMLKVCDLGSAGDASENEITPYLVSRFYRAPEIILGMPYDFGIDMWSIGCTLFELYTGKILFTGRNNNQMLRSIMECRGKFSMKMLKKAEYAGLHFDENLMFRSLEKDKITGKDVLRMLNFVKPTRDLKTRMMGTTKGLVDTEVKELNLFLDLLDKCLALNPEKRITPTEALKHPFISRSKV